MSPNRAHIAPVELRLRNPVVNARSRYDVRRGFLFTLELGDWVGVGEAMPLDGFGTETLGQAEAALRRIAAGVDGWPAPHSIEDCRERLDSVAEAERSPAARHALECALLDIAARVQGLPVARLLSPEAQRSVRVNALLSAAQAGALAAEGTRACDEGFEVLKVKVGGRPFDEDLARLQALRAAVGHRATIRIDANGSWGSDALANLKRFSYLDLELCEQPVAAVEVGSLRLLREAGVCPIAADEAVATAEAGRALLEGPGPAVDLLALRPMVLGGLLNALDLARAAERGGVGSFVVSSLEGPVGRAAALHLAAALPGHRWASGLGVAALFEEAGDADPLPVHHGHIDVPTGPGFLPRCAP